MGIDVTKDAGFFVTLFSVSLHLLAVRPSEGLRPRLLRNANPYLAGTPVSETQS